MTATGTLFDEYLVTVMMTSAAVLNLAVLRDKGIKESLAMAAGRRLVIAAQVWLAVRFLFIISTMPDSGLSWYGFFGYVMWSFGSSMCALDHLVRRWRRPLSSSLTRQPPEDTP